MSEQRTADPMPYLQEAIKRLFSLASQGRCKCQATSGYTHHCEKCRALAWIEKTKEELRL